MLISIVTSIVIVFHGAGHQESTAIVDHAVVAMQKTYGIELDSHITIHVYDTFTDYRDSIHAHRLLVKSGGSSMLIHRISRYIVAQHIVESKRFNWVHTGIGLVEYQRSTGKNPFHRSMCKQVPDLDKALGGDPIQSFMLVSYLVETNRMKFVVKHIHNGHLPKRSWINAMTNEWGPWAAAQCG